jgi:hypothetical protein
MSVFDERLASSAPLSSFLGVESSGNSSSGTAAPEFTLLEEEDDGNRRVLNHRLALVESDHIGMDDVAESSPTFRERFADEEDVANSPEAELSASPVLMSCLRDIARMPKRL